MVQRITYFQIDSNNIEFSSITAQLTSNSFLLTNITDDTQDQNLLNTSFSISDSENSEQMFENIKIFEEILPDRNFYIEEIIENCNQEFDREKGTKLRIENSKEENKH